MLLVCVRVCRCACVQAYRELGAKRGITKPNMVIPRTAHPAFLKVPLLCVCVRLWTHAFLLQGCQYFQIAVRAWFWFLGFDCG